MAIKDDNFIGYHWPSFWLSRFNFVLVHIFTVFYWFPFLLNNLLNFPWIISTLDADKTQPPGVCTPIHWDNVIFDIGLWAVWWGQHSIMSREVFKRIIGTWGSPIDRPLFGLASCLSLSVYTLFWRPISDCTRADFTDLSRIFSFQVLFGAILVFISVAFVLSYFWILPTHVFGTDHYIIRKVPAAHGIITGYPYGIVRHPAAAGFLWLFWSFPSYTTNHLFYTLQWTIFILVGTLFEEGGIKKDNTEFGRQYKKYSSAVSAFIPRIGFFFGRPIKID